jgi:DNA end-binding protein Ku
MAPHPFWSGYLKLSLVTCPVAMVPAITDLAKVRFHTLNRKTGNRVASRYIDAVTGKPVADEDQAKGYPRGEDDYVLLEDDELDSVGLETTRTIDIEMFVPAGSIGLVWYDRPHYLTPNDPVGEEAFCVIRDAMAATRMVGISRLVMYQRERAVMLQARDRGIVLWTLRYGDEVRDPETCFGNIGNPKPDAAAMAMLKRMIDSRTRPWKPSMIDDPVQDRLLDIIASRRKGKRPAKVANPAPEPSGNVINIMDALRKSIASGRG